MSIIFICCGLVFCMWCYVFFVQKNYLHLITYIFIGIFIPILLYSFNWSKLIDKSQSSMYSYMIVVITFITLVYTLFTCKIKGNRLKADEIVSFTKFGKSILPSINMIFIVLYLVENYLGSGTIIPGLRGIDVHNKYSAPIISYITNASFLFTSFDFLAFKATGKKKYLVYLGIILFMPIITRSSRFIMVITVVQLISLYFLFEREKKELTQKELKRTNRRNRIIIVSLAVLALLLNMFTNYRMSHYGKYDITYYKMTQWCGPKFLTWMAPIYGYFALSFNNLKINILYREIEHNYLGIHSFASFYFGLLQIDNILGVDISEHVNNNLITNGSANVPTGFWDFYYDYGALFFIPFIVAILICNYFLKKSYNEEKTIYFRVMYCWYVSYFAFMSFQNSLFMYTSLISGALLLFIMKYSFKVIKKSDIQLRDKEKDKND